jgi:hypothetical protein
MPGGIDYELAYRCWRNNAAMACAYVARRMYAADRNVTIDAFDQLNEARKIAWFDKAERRMKALGYKFTRPSAVAGRDSDETSRPAESSRSFHGRQDASM